MFLMCLNFKPQNTQIFINQNIRKKSAQSAKSASVKKTLADYADQDKNKINQIHQRE